MITVEQTDISSISFYFKIEDIDDTNKIIDTFKRAVETSEALENCILKVDKRIFKNKKNGYLEMKLIVDLGEGIVSKDNDNFILELDLNDLEYGIDLLQGYIDTGYFEVAEFAKVTRLNGKQLIQIYFIN